MAILIFVHLPFDSNVHTSTGTYEVPRETMIDTKNVITFDLDGVFSLQKACLAHCDIFEGDRSVGLMSTLAFRLRYDYIESISWVLGRTSPFNMFVSFSIICELAYRTSSE